MANASSPRATYRCIAGAYVAENPQKRGVIEFYGGALFELLPQISYDYLLQGLFNRGYTIIAVPFQFSLDHARVAFDLMEKRDRIRKALNLPRVCQGFTRSCQEFPHFWLGHSIGCKIIALLEAMTSVPGGSGIANEPSLLMAPDISDTKDTVPWPFWRVLDALGQGVSPTKAQTEKLIASRADLFTLTGLVSFAKDDIAGNAAGTLPKRGKSDVKWFLDELKSPARRQDTLLHRELPGGHLAPLGFRLGPWLVDAQPGDWISRVPQVHAMQVGSSELDAVIQTLADFLEKLRERIPPRAAIEKSPALCP